MQHVLIVPSENPYNSAALQEMEQLLNEGGTVVSVTASSIAGAGQSSYPRYGTWMVIIEDNKTVGL